MPTADEPFVRPGDRIAIVAGSGQLPIDLAQNLSGRGFTPIVVMLQGEASPSLSGFDHESLTLEEFPKLLPLLKRRQVTHVVFAGGIERRPRLWAIKPKLALIAKIPRAIAALSKGDDGLLRAITREVKSRGIRVVGAHQIMPDLLAVEGTMTKALPTRKDWADIEAGRKAAIAIGALDIGQAAIAIGGRVVALEGVEGTAGLLERTKSLRTHGRIAGKKRGVLVKCSKPGQELRVDLPSIGSETVAAAHAAELAGIAVEAGRSLILDFGGVIREANRLGMFVVGLPSDNVQ